MRWELNLVDDETIQAAGVAEDEAVQEPATEEEPAKEEPAQETSQYGFHALMVPEGVWSSDGRQVGVGAVTVREGPNMHPLMGLLENSEMHQRSVNIGHFEKIELNGNMWEGWGQWADSPDAWASRYAVRTGDVTAVSADMAVTKVQYLMEKPDESDEEDEGIILLADGSEPAEEDIDGVKYLVMDMPTSLMRATEVELLGATIVPFSAFAQCTIIDLRPDEQEATDSLAAANVPTFPAKAFRLPGGHSVDYGITVEDDGRIHGYPAASWTACHVGYPNECKTPPHSATNYAYFAQGSLLLDNGERVRVGQLTLKGGHAARHLSAQEAMRHYDDTDAAFADVAIGEDQHGMWVAGLLRDGITPAQVRVAMASGFSGDWRPLGGGLELIALSAVNTRGFHPKAHSYEDALGMVASLIIDMPHPTPAYEDSVVERIAASIGRSFDQRRADLWDRVHGKAS